MGIELIFVAIALGIVVITRGSFKQLFKTRLSHWWTLIFVVAGNLVVDYAPIPKSQYNTVGLAVLLFTYVMLFGFCCANLNLRGMWIVLVGLASNAFVIGLNRGMPVKSSNGYVAVESVSHQARASTDLLPWLSDVITFKNSSVAISVGDIIFGVGIIAVCFFASRKPAPTTALAPVENAGLDSDIILEIDAVMANKLLEDDHVNVFIDLTEVRDLEADKEFMPHEISVVEAVILSDDVILSETKDLSPESDKAMLRSSQRPGGSKSDPARMDKAERLSKRRARKRWSRTHGMQALPSKESLGFDKASMEIVESAK